MMKHGCYTDDASAVERVLELSYLLLVFVLVVRQTLNATLQHVDLSLKVAQLRVLLIDLVSNFIDSLRRLLQPTTPACM